MGHDLDRGLRLLRLAIDTHLITGHHALPLLLRHPGGLVVEVTDGTTAYDADHYRVSLFYDQAFIKEPGTREVTQWHQDLPFWPALGNDKDADDADQEPGSPQPPCDLERGVNHIPERQAGSAQGFIGDDAGVQQNRSQHDEKEHAHHSAATRMMTKQEMRQQPT